VPTTAKLKTKQGQAHRSQVMAKLKLHKQSDLVHYAIQTDIAKLQDGPDPPRLTLKSA
jgi:hypothetical protein